MSTFAMLKRLEHQHSSTSILTYNSSMFVGGIEFFFGLVVGLILLIAAVITLPKIGRSAVRFCKGQAGDLVTAVWVIMIVAVGCGIYFSAAMVWNATHN